MPPNAAAALKNVSLVGQNKTAVVVGGTRGIGGGVARLLARIGCSRIIILGRSESQGKETVEILKNLAPKGSNVVAEFVKGDLSDKKGMNAAVTAIQEVAGDAGIDYLILCQNGTPPGLDIKENAEGHDVAFAIQGISRFAFSYILTTRGGLAPNAIVMSICNQGQSLDDMSVDDLSLKTRLAARPSATTLFLQQSKRDSTVLDSCFEEFNIRYPQYRYYSLLPGLVKTEHFDPNFAPGFIKWVMWLGIRLIGTTPDEYANYPVYILASPEAPKTLGSSRYFNRILAPSALGKWSQDPKNREKLWEKMKDIIGEN
ncbi:hypothetical protein K438DRAFT_2022271 [Mycena galopus ATCC 62051]|nr:hypothetical protein K438DRAFT_2022271 [Mycena galopus ATCC 62051]